MLLRDVENRYWYLEQLKDFAGRIGIPAAAWKELKGLDVPKDYASWVKARAKRRGKSR